MKSFLVLPVWGVVSAAGFVKMSDFNSADETRFSADDDYPDFEITYSEDGMRIQLPSFLLQIYDTDGDLPEEPTYTSVEDAINEFLMAELNQFYYPQYQIDFVNTTVYTDDQVELQINQRHLLPKDQQTGPTRRERIEWEENHGSLETLEEERKFLRGRRNVETIVGSELLTRVNLTFSTQPTPSDNEVIKNVRNVMQDLTYLVTNLTATGDPELANVRMAFRLEIPTLAPTFTPSLVPSMTPSVKQTPLPTVAPTTKSPTAAPTTAGPIQAPTNPPTIPPTTSAPTGPTSSPTKDDGTTSGNTNPSTPHPTIAATPPPTIAAPPPPVTRAPTVAPTPAPVTPAPTVAPTPAPVTPAPTVAPTPAPVTPAPTVAATSLPVTPVPTVAATSLPVTPVPTITAAIPSPNTSAPTVAATPTSGSPANDATDDSTDTSGVISPGGGSASVTSSPDDTRNTVIISTVISASFLILVTLFALALVRRRRRRYEDESLKEEVDVIGPYDTRSVADDSIFSGLTDILTDTGSPRLRQAKSMSSATTVKANNMLYGDNFKSPTSMAGASTLFAFSEEDEKDLAEESQPELKGSDVSEDTDDVLLNPHTTRDLDLTGETPLRSNVASKDPPSEKGGNFFGAFLAGGAALVAGTAVAAAARGGSNNDDEDTDDGGFPSPDRRNSRHHAGKGQEDGTSEYQQAMHPVEYQSDVNDDDSDLSSAEDRYTRQFVFAQHEAEGGIPKSPLFSPRSQNTKVSSLSGSTSSKGSDVSPSRQLINDLVWLEKKIADVRSTAGSVGPSTPGAIEHADSLSYKSQDASISPSSCGESTTLDSNGITQNIVCRDCFAPPGKLQIVIHSTKDGPAVHTVKQGSSLEGHVFPGDLIIAVDNVDTRTFSAEQVMKMMASKSGFERKITVLHYEN